MDVKYPWFLRLNILLPTSDNAAVGVMGYGGREKTSENGLILAFVRFRVGDAGNVLAVSPARDFRIG